MFIKYFQQRFPEHFASSSAVTATERSAVAARWKAIAPHVLRAASRQLGSWWSAYSTMSSRTHLQLTACSCSGTRWFYLIVLFMKSLKLEDLYDNPVRLSVHVIHGHHVHQCYISTIVEHLQGWWLCQLAVQPWESLQHGGWWLLSCSRLDLNDCIPSSPFQLYSNL